MTKLVVIAALLAGCGKGGVLGMGMDAGRSDGSVDVAEEEVLDPFQCPNAIRPFDCAAPVRPGADGHIVDFSWREWSGATGKWCNATGLHGAIFSFRGAAPNDSNAANVAMDGSLRLSLSVSPGSFGGGGLAFEAGCLDATAFNGVQFTIAIASGSLTGCTYQVLLQTFEQRPTSQSPPGGCDISTTSCYAFPAASNLPAPSTDPTMPTPVMAPFSAFSTSMMPAPAQIVGLQWMLNSSSEACTVELRIDDVAFIPAPATP